MSIITILLHPILLISVDTGIRRGPPAGRPRQGRHQSGRQPQPQGGVRQGQSREQVRGREAVDHAVQGPRATGSGEEVGETGDGGGQGPVGVEGLGDEFGELLHLW